MSKKIFLIIVIVIFILVIVITVIPKGITNKVENTMFGEVNSDLVSTNISSTTESTNTSSNSNENTTTLNLINNKRSNYNDNGYFYIDSENIKYFDYATKKKIYLCNKANCKHNTNACSSYLSLANAGELFSFGNYLYIITSTRESVSIDAQTGESIPSKSSPKIYRMNLDGTNKEELFECPSGTAMNMPYIVEGNLFYAFFSKSKQVKSGTLVSSVETEKKLVKIDLKTKKYEEILDAKNKTILGVYGNSIILEEIEYKENPEKFLNNDSAYINNLNNSIRKIKLFNPSSRMEVEVYSDTYKNIDEIASYGGKIYFIPKGSSKLQYINLDNKEVGTVIELQNTGATINGIYDNKLLYVYYSSDSKINKAYYIDLETNENKEFKLFDNNRYLVEILAQNKDYYFVRKGYKMSGKYTTWAGTKQTDIEDVEYALIRKSDYWSSNAVYIDMQDAEN